VAVPIAPCPIEADVTVPPLSVKKNPTVKEAGTLLFTVKLNQGAFVVVPNRGLFVPVKPTPLASCPPHARIVEREVTSGDAVKDLC
jgi:hypothetical protein